MHQNDNLTVAVATSHNLMTQHNLTVAIATSHKLMTQHHMATRTESVNNQYGIGNLAR